MVTVVSTIFFLNEEGKCAANLPVLMNEWKGGLKLLLHLTFYIYLVREILVLSGNFEK